MRENAAEVVCDFGSEKTRIGRGNIICPDTSSRLQSIAVLTRHQATVRIEIPRPDIKLSFAGIRGATAPLERWLESARGHKNGIHALNSLLLVHSRQSIHFFLTLIFASLTLGFACLTLGFAACLVMTATDRFRLAVFWTGGTSPKIRRWVPLFS